MELGITFPMTIPVTIKNFHQLMLLNELSIKLNEAETQPPPAPPVLSPNPVPASLPASVAAIIAQPAPPPEITPPAEAPQPDALAKPWPPEPTLSRTSTYLAGERLADACELELLERSKGKHVSTADLARFMYPEVTHPQPRLVSLKRSRFLMAGTISNIAKATKIPMATLVKAIGEDNIKGPVAFW